VKSAIVYLRFGIDATAADANQCMRVSSALEAGTVSITATPPTVFVDECLGVD
jgi:hypothetical protein